MSLQSTRVALAISAFIAWSSLATPASAHTELASSNPLEGSQLREVPGNVSLTFTDQVSAQFAQLTLTAQGESVPLSPVSDSAHTVTAAVSLNRFSAGPKFATTSWILSYRVVSLDGHPIEGSVTFNAPFQPSGGSREETDAPASDTANSSQKAGPSSAATALTVGMMFLALMIGAIGVRAGHRRRTSAR